eukprot:TRINITY_DN2329_c0_g1_i2.p1 TRINITY_DN2329_c0_g1~~TRINITY_DN2329_c0_g1_i2.p1  ORF type:complete len:534 (-),score=111.22 TRINITY_DN2329_c0_g1_i2:70-1671(-)
MRKGRDTISMPYNIVHEVHVDTNFQWSGNDADTLFTLGDKLGEGAFGAVYVGKLSTSKFPLAIKELTRKGDKRQDEMLKNEIDVLKQCRNPNIVSYYGCVGKEDKLYILMDYCKFGSVRDLIDSGLADAAEPLNEAQIKWLTYNVLLGLVYLHGRHIIHRDIKAGNILITEAGVVKLADFGVSDTLGMDDETIGSPYWMAPEVAIGGQGYNTKCDLWSLGITIMEMAEGYPPLAGLHPLEAMKQVPKRKPPTLQEPHLWSADFAKFIAQTLTWNPANRPSALDLLSAQGTWATAGSGADVLRSRLLESLRHRKEKKKQNSPAVEPPAASKTATFDGATTSPTKPAEKEEDDNARWGVVKTGYLSKRGGLNTQFKQRWFVLEGNYLCYYKGPELGTCLGEIPIQDSFVREAEKEATPYCFEINVREKRNYIFNAPDQEAMKSWMTAIKQQKNYFWKKTNTRGAKTPEPRSNALGSPSSGDKSPTPEQKRRTASPSWVAGQEGEERKEKKSNSRIIFNHRVSQNAKQMLMGGKPH